MCSSGVRLDAPPAAWASTIPWSSTGIADAAGSTWEARIYRSARGDQSDAQQARTAVPRSAGSAIPRNVSNWPAKDASAVSSQRADERTASWPPAPLVTPLQAASSAAPPAGSSGARARASRIDSARRLASGPPAPATSRAVRATLASATWRRYASAVRQTPSGTGNPARGSRPSVAALGPTRAAVAASASRSRTARSGNNEDPQHAIGIALVVAERRRRPVKWIGVGDEAVQLHRAGRHEPDGGLEIRRDERARAHERQLLHVHREGREVLHRLVADRVEQEHAAGAEHLHGRTHEARIAGGVDHEVSPVPSRQRQHLGDDVAPRRIDGCVGSHAPRQIALPGAPRDGDDRARTRELRDPRVEESRGALAEHHHGVAGIDAHPPLRVVHGGQGLDERGGLEADLGGEGVEIPLGENHLLGQRAVELAAEQPRPATEALVAPQAAVARAARDDRVDHDPRAHRDAHIGTNRLHDARGLVAEHHWVAHAGMLPGVDGKVRVADGSGGGANERRAPTGPRRGPFGHLEAARRLENGESHPIARGELPRRAVRRRP